MRNKRIFCVTVTILFCLFLVGCSNDFARVQYDLADIISSSKDRYTKVNSSFSSIDGGYSLEVSKFDGRETLWSKIMDEKQRVEIDFSLSLSQGQVKIVHIDAGGNVTTLIECSSDTSMDGFETKTVLLKKGQNRLKIVGYDCEDVDLKMMFEEP